MPDAFQPILPTPGTDERVNQEISTPVDNSEATVLSGVSDIVDDVSKGIQEYTKQSQLNAKVSSFSNIETNLSKMVLGAQQDPEQAKSLSIRSNALVSQAVTDDPLNAPAIRDRAKAILGYVPSEQVVADANHYQNLVKANQDQFYNESFQAAAKTGFYAIDPNDPTKPDMQAMVLKGAEINARNTQIENQGKLYALQPGQDAAKLQSLLPHVSSLLTDSDTTLLPAYNNIVTATGNDKQARENALSLAAAQHETNIRANVSQMEDSMGINVEGRKQIDDMLTARFAPYKGLASSPVNEAQNTLRNADTFQNTFKTDAFTTMPTVMHLESVFGQSAVGALMASTPNSGTGAVVTQAANQYQANTTQSDFQKALVGDQKQDQFNNTVRVGLGALDYNQLPDDHKQPVLNSIVPAVQANNKTISTLSPTALDNHANMVGAITTAGKASDDPSNQSNFFKFVNNASFQNSFNYTSSKSNTAEKSTVSAQNIIDTAKNVLSSNDLSKVQYNPKTDIVSGGTNPTLINQAVTALNFYSKYDPSLSNKAALQDYKNKAFNVPAPKGIIDRIESIF